MSRPALSAAPEWYHKYINTVKEDDIDEALQQQTRSFNDFLKTIPVSKREFRYVPGKWTIKEVMQHIIDAERVFAYRALRFARKDTTPLPGFDENAYADQANTGNRDWDDLMEEFNALRRSTEILFHSFDEEQLEAVGIASGNPVSVLALGYIIAGHANHHMNIIKERYL